MAIARGAGTEIIRSAHFENVDGDTKLIIGVQHHIYTVLSIIVHCHILNATSDRFRIFIIGYDAEADDTGLEIYVTSQNVPANSTWVWNDKFSFNGFEPLGSAMTGAMSTVPEQDAIADQGGSATQYLMMGTDNATQDYDVHVTYIDQNNE